VAASFFSTENIFQNVAYFSPLKNHHTSHHVSPRIHHQLTTKTPRFCTSFLPNPLKNSSKNNETPAFTGAPFFSGT
jgi:hypothetical protein